MSPYRIMAVDLTNRPFGATGLVYQTHEVLYCRPLKSRKHLHFFWLFTNWPSQNCQHLVELDGTIHNKLNDPVHLENHEWTVYTFKDMNHYPLVSPKLHCPTPQVNVKFHLLQRLLHSFWSQLNVAAPVHMNKSHLQIKNMHISMTKTAVPFYCVTITSSEKPKIILSGNLNVEFGKPRIEWQGLAHN